MTASEPSGNHSVRELAQTLAEHGPEPVNRWIGLPCYSLPESPSGNLREDCADLIISLAAGLTPPGSGRAKNRGMCSDCGSPLLADHPRSFCRCPALLCKRGWCSYARGASRSRVIYSRRKGLFP